MFHIHKQIYTDRFLFLFCNNFPIVHSYCSFSLPLLLLINISACQIMFTSFSVGGLTHFVVVLCILSTDCLSGFFLISSFLITCLTCLKYLISAYILRFCVKIDRSDTRTDFGRFRNVEMEDGLDEARIELVYPRDMNG